MSAGRNDLFTIIVEILHVLEGRVRNYNLPS